MGGEETADKSRAGAPVAAARQLAIVMNLHAAIKSRVTPGFPDGTVGFAPKAPASE